MSDRKKRAFKRPQEPETIPRDVDEEVRFHIENRVERLIAGGMNEGEARRVALRKFGNVEEVKAAMTWEQRAGIMGQSLDRMWQDVGLALRTLLKDRGFTVVTVLTLALAIGANTAIFSVVDGVLRRPLPYPDEDRIVAVRAQTRPETGGGGTPFSDRGFWHFANNNRSFDIFAG